MVSISESTLVVFVPEAEPLAGPFRSRYDPSAALGMPAHITVLYPFKAPVELTPPVIGKLRLAFSRISPFDTCLDELRQFPIVLYLAPNPDSPFQRLTRAVVREFPGNPPYAGAYPAIVPHLTVAHAPAERSLADIAAEFEAIAAKTLPIRAHVSEVALVDNEQGRWVVRETFPLGPVESPRASRRPDLQNDGKGMRP